MKKLLWILVILVLVAIFGGRVWYLNKNKSDETNTVKIGVLSVLSGTYAFIGEEMNQGIQMAVEEFNSNHQLQMKTYIEDSKGISKDAINAFNKIVMHKVDALIAMGDNPVPAIAHLAVENNIPTVATVIGTQEFLNNNKGKTTLFNNWPTSYIGIKPLAKFAKNKLGIKTVATLYMIGPLGEESIKGFKEEFGQDFVVSETFRENDMDLRNQVAKIVYQKPDAVLVIGYGHGYTVAINQLKESQFKGYILSDNKAGDSNTKSVVKDLSSIYYYDTADANNEMYNQFSKEYTKRFGKEPSTFAMTGYDSIKRIGKALELSGKENIQDGLLKLKEMDATFGHLKFFKNGTVEYPLVIKQMQSDGTAKIIKE